MKIVGRIDTEKLIRARKLVEEFDRLHGEIMNEIEKFTGKLNYFLDDSMEPYHRGKFLFELLISPKEGFGYVVVKHDGEIALTTLEEMFSD